MIKTRPLTTQELADLKAARELITPDDGWTTETEARNAEGVAVLFDSPDATCFCAIGALSRAVFNRTGWRSYDAERLILQVDERAQVNHEGRPLYKINDLLGKDAVLAIFDEVIAEGVSA